MKQSHLPYLNQPPPNNTRSLKAILKQTYVPLSHYIHQKPTHNKNDNSSYVSKLKEMMKNNKNHTSNYENGQTQNPSHSPNHQQTYNISINKTQNRTKSINRHTPQPLIKRQTFNPKQVQQKRLLNIQSYQPQNKQFNLLLKQQKQSQINKKDYYNNIGKQMRKEIINYLKFEKLTQSNSQQQQINKVQITNLLGSGAGANVKLARNLETGTYYAVKIYQKYKLIDQKKKKRVYKQIKILNNLNHPNIIKLLKAYENKREIHLIFQFIYGCQTLQNYILKNYISTSMNIHSQKQSIIEGIVKGLSYLHQFAKIAHRDIKPDNILISTQNNIIVKIIDFGYATSKQIAQMQCGTLSYMSPQVLSKNPVYCPFKADIWSFGVLLYYLYENILPFKGFNQKDLIQNIKKCEYSMKKSSNLITEIIKKSMILSPSQRASIDQIIQRMKIQ